MLEITEQFRKTMIKDPKKLEVGSIYRRIFHSTEDGRSPILWMMKKRTGIPENSKLHDYWLCLDNENITSLSGFTAEVSGLTFTDCHFELARARITILGE